MRGSAQLSDTAQGPRMVRDVFRLAKENAPAIIFIDEVDAIATARFDAQTGADRSAFGAESVQAETPNIYFFPARDCCTGHLLYGEHLLFLQL